MARVFLRVHILECKLMFIGGCGYGHVAVHAVRRLPWFVPLTCRRSAIIDIFLVVVVAVARCALSVLRSLRCRIGCRPVP